jgi:hypothetical protein
VLLVLIALLDLSPAIAPGRAVAGGLELALSYLGGATRGGAQRLLVRAKLTNVSDQPVRIVWQPSGEQPLSLLVDGETEPLPLRPATAALIGWRELAPGESVSDSLSLILPVGTHALAWRYVVVKGPYGRPLTRCWTGTLITPTRTVSIPSY